MSNFVRSFSLVFLVLAAATHVSAGIRLVDEENGRVTVDVTFPSPPDGERIQTLALPGRPAVRYARFFVAVPEGADVRVRMEGGVSRDRRGGLPEIRANEPGAAVADEPWRRGLFPAQPYGVSGPFTYRKTAVVAIDCFASQVDYGANTERRWSEYRLVVEYPPSLGGAAGPADPLLADLIINKRYAPRPSAAARAAAGATTPLPDPHFDRSPNWVKIRVTSTGVYAISGSDLAQIGVNLPAIDDPASFRLFTLGAGQLPRTLRSGTGTWVPGEWATECDILVEYGGDGTFDPSDRIVFYGLGIEGYADLYRPGETREAVKEHIYARENVYFLTWDETSSFPGPPGRMATASAAPVAGADITTFEQRLHFEENRVDDFEFGGDGWLWLDIAKSVGSETRIFDAFTVRDLDPARPQTFRTLALAPFVSRENNFNHHAEYIMNGTLIGDVVWDVTSFTRYEDGVPVVVTGSFLQEGTNTLWLRVPRDVNSTDFMYFDHYEILYQRRLRAFNDALRFSSPDSTGTVNFAVTDFSSAGTLHVFDVSDPFRPVALSGFIETPSGGRRDVRFSSALGGRHYYWASTAAAFRKPLGMSRYFPTDLRNVTTSPNMIIVTDESFRASAERLRTHRLSRLPFFSNPDVKVVTGQEIYDNFAAGLPDPMAFRNYFKFLYDNFTDGGAPLLTFVLLLGDANFDFKNFRSTQPNFVTTNLNFDPFTLDAYATDDWFVAMDPTDEPGKVFIDIAVGRLPAASVEEADFLVSKVIDYENSTDFGPWRDRVILAADDEASPSNDRQPQFIQQSEAIAHGFMSTYLDPFKLYLTEFPAIQGIKPAARLQFLNSWNAGALIINYVGHGSSVQVADEQVFLAADVGNLRNGGRLPLFMALSCTIGNFGSPQGKSLSERLLLKSGGGVIGTITASQLTFIGPNQTFNYNLFRETFPASPGAPQPMGVGLLEAKFQSLSIVDSSRLVEENNQKYNLLGDPALRLLSPRRSIELVAADVDTMTTGTRQTVRGTVYNNGQPDPTFSGRAHLIVREPDDISGYTRASDGYHISYRYPAGTVYVGTADVAAGQFQFSFQIPRFAAFGRNAFVLAYAENGLTDAVALEYNTIYVQPSAGDSTALQPLDGPPRVDLGFAGVGRTVKPGAILQARIVDADGINILSTTPEGKLALVFDDTNLPLDVTEFFEFDHGGVDTSGTLRFPLPDISVGSHRAVLKAADSFGQTSLDTVEFEVTDPLDYRAEVVLNYPNPFQTSTYFLLDLSDRAMVRLDIFTVSGKRIRTLEETKDAGEAWILWDGRDASGGEIANGAYLYVARVDFEGIDRPALTLRGTVVKIE